MLTEKIMARFGWTDVWAPHIPNPDLPTQFSFMVGVWTGPERDLLCVRPCATNEEAEQCLSPAARSILGAVVKSTGVRFMRWLDDELEKPLC